MLALHSAERDRALGLPRPGARTMSLLDWRRKREKAATEMLTQAALLKSIIDECQMKAHQLIEDADTPEKRREILPEAQRLNDLAGRAATALEKMTDG